MPSKTLSRKADTRANSAQSSPEPPKGRRVGRDAKADAPASAQPSPIENRQDFTFVTHSQRGRRALFQSDRGAAVDTIKFAIEHLIEAANLPTDQCDAFRAAVNASLEAAKQGLLAPREDAQLFELPKGLSWPTESYTVALKSGRVRNIVEFLEDENGWFPLIKAGLVSRKILRARDRSAENGITNYVRDGKRELPAHVRIPTKSEGIDKLAEAYRSHGDRPIRVYQALQRRKDRASQP